MICRIFLVVSSVVVAIQCKGLPPKSRENDVEVFNITATTAQSVILPCGKADTSSKEVAWSKDGDVIVLDDLRFSVDEEGNLHINAVELSDEGTYKCGMLVQGSEILPRRKRWVFGKSIEIIVNIQVSGSNNNVVITV